jgi:hypothetical protein
LGLFSALRFNQPFNLLDYSTLSVKKLSATNVKEIIDKIEKRQVNVLGVKHPKPKPKQQLKPKAEAAENVPDKAQVPEPNKPVEPAKPKPEKPVKPAELEALVPAKFPFDAKINKYGFLYIGKSELLALGLNVVTEKKAKLKIAEDAKVSITAFNPETREFTIKIL